MPSFEIQVDIFVSILRTFRRVKYRKKSKKISSSDNSFTIIKVQNFETEGRGKNLGIKVHSLNSEHVFYLIPLKTCSGFGE